MYLHTFFRWDGDRDPGFVSCLPKWAELGATMFGGCCRVTPEDIGLIRQFVDGNKNRTENND